jgi:hypothetical protein
MRNGTVAVACGEGAIRHLHQQLAAAKREIVTLEQNHVAFQNELDALREQVLEVIEDMLLVMLQRSSTLSVLERLVAAVR